MNRPSHELLGLLTRAANLLLAKQYDEVNGLKDQVRSLALAFLNECARPGAHLEHDVQKMRRATSRVIDVCAYAWDAPCAPLALSAIDHLLVTIGFMWPSIAAPERS